MWSNTKLLILSSFLIIISGLGLLWFGFKPETQLEQSPGPVPYMESTSTPHSTSLSATSSAVVGIEGERALVTKVIDGDTFQIESRLTVRILGVDTPETVDPRRPVGCFGKEASNETKRLLSGKSVILQKDVSETDKYGRLLRYIFLDIGEGQLLFVNDYLIREGFGKVLTIPPDVKHTEQFLEAQRQAKKTQKGLWGVC